MEGHSCRQVPFFLVAWDEPHVSVGGLLGWEKGQGRSARTRNEWKKVRTIEGKSRLRRNRRRKDENMCTKEKEQEESCNMITSTRKEDTSWWKRQVEKLKMEGRSQGRL